MKNVILLSGEHIDLAVGELNGALKCLNSEIHPDLIDGRSVYFKDQIKEGVAARMGFAHFQGSVSFFEPTSEGAVNEAIDTSLDDMDRSRSISISILSPGGKGDLSRGSIFKKFDELARKRGFQVFHREPEQRCFFNVGEYISTGPITEETERGTVDERRGSKMPFNRPIVMEPKLARAMVNLSGLDEGSTLLDPFMGPAGLAIEAGHLGFNVIGIERDEKIFQGARINIEAQCIGDRVTTLHGDSRKMMDLDIWDDIPEIHGIVTDPPFGRSAPLMGEDPSKLIMEVVGIASEKMGSGSPLVMDTSKEENLGSIPGFELERSFSFRVHRSLTRFIGILKKQ
jgi:tRNA (guanine10-N2)-dimethyltransferase